MLGSYKGSYSQRYNQLPHDETDWTPPTDGSYRSVAWKAYILVLHFLVIISLGLAVLRPQASCLLASELPFARDHIAYVEQTFLPSGFAEGPQPPNPYLGPPTAERDALWEQLYDVGNVVITAAEAQQLTVTTTGLIDDQAIEDTEHQLVTLEMFHQLHCLDYLRHASYSASHHAGESSWSKTHHVGHCVDYLRQVLMCHGDLTPITLRHVPGVPALPFPNRPPYVADFAIQHTCRDFSLIYDFALQRNTSGYSVA